MSAKPRGKSCAVTSCPRCSENIPLNALSMFRPMQCVYADETLSDKLSLSVGIKIESAEQLKSSKLQHVSFVRVELDLS